MDKRKERKLFPERFETKYTLLGESKSPKVDKLYEIYGKDPYKARIIFMNDSHGYKNHRYVLFTEKNGDFSLVHFRRKFGISKTNRIYHREVRVTTITYTKKKFYVKRNRNIRQLTYHQLMMGESGEFNTLVKDYLRERFSWIRFMEEHQIGHDLSFGTIMTNKLFNLKAMMKHVYKMPYPQAKLVHKHLNHMGNFDATRLLVWYKEYYKNIESLKESWLTDKTMFGYLEDTLKLAKTLDKKVNLSWSDKRLKEEHDNMSELITDVVYIDGDREMSIDKRYLAFAEFTGYNILKTTKQMAMEGKRQKHCVATYVNDVECGRSAIYQLGHWTLEVCKRIYKSKYILTIGQLRGFDNDPAPPSVLDSVTKQLIKFNTITEGVDFMPESFTYDTDDVLPF